jgi:hypothetical protein
MPMRLLIVVALVASTAGCHRVVQNINPLGQRGAQGTYGFWFDDGDNDSYGTPRPNNHALLAASRVLLVVQHCDEVAPLACISKADEIIAVDPGIVAIDGLEPYESTTFDVKFRLRGLRAGKTELLVSSGGTIVDSVVVTVVDAPRPAFVARPRRAVPGKYTIGARFDRAGASLVGNFNDDIVRSSGSIAVPSGYTYGSARAWSARDNAPPSASTTFNMAAGSGTIEVGTADRDVLAIETAQAKTIATRIVGEGLLEVEVSDEIGLIDGATCAWESAHGLEFTIDVDTELTPVKRYWVDRNRPGTATAKCRIGEARTEVTFTCTKAQYSVSCR